MAEPQTPKPPREYALSADERKALEAQYVLVTVAKAEVYDANLNLEKTKLQAQQVLAQLEQAAQQSVVKLKEAEDRAAGSLAFLAEAHGIPGARLSPGRDKLVEPAKQQ